MNPRVISAVVLLSLSGFAFVNRESVCFTQTNSGAAAAQSAYAVKSEPHTIIWIDGVRRGVTDDSGQLKLNSVTRGRHIVRLRSTGFAEKAIPVAVFPRVLTVQLTKTTDPAELAFQEAEAARETARDDEARKKAAELYRKSISLRKNHAEAHLGLARELLELNDYDAALAEVRAARTYRPGYAEASAVEGRIYRNSAYADKAIASYKRAITEAHGFQPEAHTGLGIIYEDQGRDAGAVTEFKTALSQLSDTEPVIYQLLGAVYEKQQNYKEAVAAYDKYLQLAPNGTLAPAVRSMIDQLRKQAAGEQLLP
jgi:tetratricopeptide (TPR) repeat protein